MITHDHIKDLFERLGALRRYLLLRCQTHRNPK
jgi:hypothetical protein